MSIKLTIPDELAQAIRDRAAAENKRFEIVLLEAVIRGLGLQVSDFDLSEVTMVVD